MSKKIAVDIIDVTKTFKTPLESSSGLKQKIINLTKGIKGYRTLTPLRNVSLQVEEGDFFGIVGRNGSGKSTLLKTIAGVYTPDSGRVVVNGKLVPFIELGVGFSPDLSGRENVFLNGALLGFSREEMEEMYDDIVDFAELHDFMGERLKNYSSGMQVRLAFSIAIRAKGDILLLDEVLAVGDEAFQRKCYAYFAELKKKKKTVILVTHSMESVQQFCNKAVLIDKGHDLVIGTPHEITQLYSELNSDKGVVSIKNESVKGSQSNDYFSGYMNFKKGVGEIEFEFGFAPLKDIDNSDLVMTFVIFRDSGEMLYRFTSDERIVEKIDYSQPNHFKLNLQHIFPNGNFSVQLAIKARDRSREYAVFNDIVKFNFSNGWGREYWNPNEDYEILNKSKK